MNPDEQIKALAELDGLVLGSTLGYTHEQSNQYYRPNENGTYHRISDWSDRYEYYEPNYLTSYDAIIPLIQKQSLAIRYRIATKAGPISFMVKPNELAEKLLRATGKWED